MKLLGMCWEHKFGPCGEPVMTDVVTHTPTTVFAKVCDREWVEGYVVKKETSRALVQWSSCDECGYRVFELVAPDD